MWKKVSVTLIRTSQNSVAQSYFPNILSGMQSYAIVVLFITLCQSPSALSWLQARTDHAEVGDGHSYPLCSTLCLKLQQRLAHGHPCHSSFPPALSFCSSFLPPLYAPFSFFLWPAITPHSSRGKRSFCGLFAAFFCGLWDHTGSMLITHNAPGDTWLCSDDSSNNICS